MTEKKKLMGVEGGAVGPSPSPLNKSPQILVVAGEASGDEHAARLVAAIRKFCPQAEFLGIGGEALAAQGVRILTPAAELAVVGLMEVAGHLPAVWQALRTIGRVLKATPPDLAILVDFPDFNFWVARMAKYYRVPVMYYISPQVWAWRTYRVRTLARLTDRLVVIFPFEADFYRARGVTVEYVGHPFRETLPPLTDRRTFLAQLGLDPEALTIALLPGSRGSEIQRHLPAMLEAANLIHRSIPQAQFILPLSSTAPAGLVQAMVSGEDGEVAGLKPAPTAFLLKIIPGQAYQALGAAQAAVVASGTATVEAALAGTPTVIVYRVSPLTFAVGRRLVRVPHVGMANLLAGECMFSELIQDDFTPARLANEVLSLINDPERLAAVRRGLETVIRRLGGPGASQRAAEVAVKIMAARAD